jgi:DNA-binding CsgD family transcriptional regulator
MLLTDQHQLSHPLIRSAGGVGAHPARESLTAQAKSLYRSLLSLGGVSHDTLPALLATDTAGAQSALDELRNLGLVVLEDGRVAAVPYSDVLHTLMEEQAQTLENALVSVWEAQRRLRVLLREGPWLSGDSAGTVLSASAGNNESDRNIPEIRTLPRTDLAAMHPGARFNDELLGNSVKRAEADIARGVRLRVVHQTAALSHPQSAEYLHRIEGLGGQVRLRRDLPFRLILIDGETAVCRLRWQDGLDETLLLQGPRMASLLGRLFETIWVDSVPLAGAAEDRSAVPETVRIEQTSPPLLLTDQHKTIMSYLADGATDQAIARSLGVTTRTVTRRMNEIYQALGVQSRFQAGAMARRMGLI